MATPSPSQKDGQQVLKYAFDDATGKLRVDATISPSGTDLEIHNTDDSIAIGTSTQLFTATTVGPNIGLDANVIASALPVGAATSALQTTANTSLASIDGKLTSPITVIGPLTDAELRASAIPVSAAALPLPAGASTSALQTTGNNSLASIDNKLTAPLAVTGPLTDTQLRASAVPVSAASLPLPAGASTDALQSAGNTSLASLDSKSPPLGQTTKSASIPVTIASDQNPTVTIQLFTLPFDAITATYPTSTQEIYQSRVGGVAGTVQQTLTINYTDATKSFITDVART